MISKMKLKDVGIIVTGNTPSKKNKDYYDSNDINFFTPTDFEDGRINDFEESVNYISNNAKEKARILPKGSVLVTCIGIIGKVGIVEKESAFNQQINAIIPNKDIIDNRYLAYWLISKADYLRKKANAPVVPIINKTDFQELEIVVPDMETQKEIVNKLNKMQKLIDLKEEQKCLFEDLIKSQFVEMFGSVELNDKNFEEQEISSIADISSSKRIYANEYQENGVPFYRSKEIIELGHNKKPSIELFISAKRFEEIKERYGIPKRGDILITAVGTIGETWIVDTDEPFYYKDGNVLQIRLNTNISQIYFKYVLDILISIFKSKNVSGSAYAALTIEKFKKMKIILPPIELQNQFADIVKQIDKQKFEIQKNLEEMKKTKENLMNKYFN